MKFTPSSLSGSEKPAYLCKNREQTKHEFHSILVTFLFLNNNNNNKKACHPAPTALKSIFSDSDRPRHL